MADYGTDHHKGDSPTGTNSLVARLRDAANDKSLDIGTAWNLLEEAADALEAAETLCRTYFEIAETHMSAEEIRALREKKFGEEFGVN